MYPTAAAYFHIALALSQPAPDRNLDKAIVYCRKAVEEEPREVRYWHLLALLEAKIGEWKKAKGVLEAAINVAEDVEIKAEAEELKDDGIAKRDFGETAEQAEAHSPPPESYAPTEANGQPATPPSPRTLITPADKLLPPAASLLRPIPDHPAPSHRELFEHALQLRMTQIALTELVEGPESVEAYWIDVFEWYSQRRDTNAQTREFIASYIVYLD